MADTIFARASGPGRAGVAVIRISGTAAFSAGRALAGGLPDPRTAALRVLRHPTRGDVLDEAVVIAFPGPGSFTGEDSVELQVHGSVAVVASVSSALAGIPGLRRAEPGEFTRRALANGRLDLAQVEALGDLIAAETAAQQRQALAALRGRVGRLVEAWKPALLRALALVEASIDFADDDLPPDVLVAVRAELAVLVAEMKRELGGSRVAERLRSGFEVAIVGPPNVGKSTLFNALAGREAALVSAAPGTTRDVIEVRLDLEGLPLTVLDTAGIRDAAGEIEALGIERARARAEAADVRIFLVGSAAEVDALDVPSQPGDLVIRGKADLDPDAGGVSGLTGQGIESMLAEVATVLGARMAGASSLGHARQREAVTRTLDAIEVALEELGGLAPRIELVAEDLRTAVRALDFLVGRVDVEAILDVVFGTFCLGK